MISTELVDLSRWQFALTSMYHFIFVPLTLGLSFMLVVMEACYVVTGKEVYKDMTKFWGKLFGVNFALESGEKSMTLYVAEESVIEAFKDKLQVDMEHRSILFNDLNRIPLDNIEKIVRDSVTARRSRVAQGEVPTQAQMLAIWGVTEEDAKAPPPVVRISMKSREEDVIEIIDDTKKAKK